MNDLMLYEIITGPDRKFGKDRNNIKSYLERLDSYTDVWYGGMVTSNKWFYVFNNISMRQNADIIICSNKCCKEYRMNDA